MKRKILLSVLFLMFVYTGCTGESAGSDKDTADSGSTDNALDSASDSNSEIKFDSDSNIIAGTDSDSSVILQPLRIEAECGFGADKGDCNGVSDGTNSELPGQD
ncbi:MAG: hypothetical protein JXR91_11065, partial [Deltaproteobacteria bacterium]|nr:hypothetical protein [Deltaproteobacteria bacterium]